MAWEEDLKGSLAILPQRGNFKSIWKKRTLPSLQKRGNLQKKGELSCGEAKEDEEEAPLMEGPVMPPLVFAQPISISVVTAPPPGTSGLPSVLEKLVQELAPSLRVISEKGITKTEIVVHSKTLSEITITIDHYDTAPHSFNLHFSGNEMAQSLFAKYQSELALNLQKVLPTFQCNLFAPTFREKNSLVKSRRLRYGAINKSKGYDEL